MGDLIAANIYMDGIRFILRTSHSDLRHETSDGRRPVATGNHHMPSLDYTKHSAPEISEKNYVMVKIDAEPMESALIAKAELMDPKRGDLAFQSHAAKVRISNSDFN